MPKLTELLQTWWRLGQPQRTQWTEYEWDYSFKVWLNSLDNVSLLEEMDAALNHWKESNQ